MDCRQDGRVEDEQTFQRTTEKIFTLEWGLKIEPPYRVPSSSLSSRVSRGGWRKYRTGEKKKSRASILDRLDKDCYLLGNINCLSSQSLNIDHN